MSGEGGSSAACTSCLSQLNLAASPLTVQPAPQPEVASVTGVPLVQANPTGDHVFLAYNAVAGGPFGTWSAATPNQFTTSLAKESAIDLAASSDATIFASRTNTVTEIRDATLTLTSSPAAPELEQIPGRVLIPGLTLHPSGALLYQPFSRSPSAQSRPPPPRHQEAPHSPSAAAASNPESP
jgi:hypothetical protein